MGILGFFSQLSSKIIGEPELLLHEHTDSLYEIHRGNGTTFVGTLSDWRHGYKMGKILIKGADRLKHEAKLIEL